MSASQAIDLRTEPGEELRWRVSGMDCPSCISKIETAIARLPGVSDIRVNLSAETVAAKVDQSQSPADAVERRIRALGYKTQVLADRASPDADHLDGSANIDAPWWWTPRSRLVGGIGILLAAAFLASYLMPGVSTAAYIAAALIGLVPFGRRALALAWSGSPFSIEMLMSVATIGAIAIGAASEAAIVVFLFAIGELLENVAAGRARAGIKSLMSLVPRTALLEESGQTREVPVASLRVGQIVLVRPGDRVPSDGEILEGNSSLDESPVTGESVPAEKSAGDAVFAGSINASGVLRVRVAKTAADNTIARIIHMVEEAQGSKAPTARFIDRFSNVYTPAAMIVSALVILVPPLAFGADWYTWIYRGLALLLIACPCALVLSTPAAIASGIAAGARRGLLIKGGAALEAIGTVATVAFDKTGTLTEGRPRVTDVIPLKGDQREVLALAAAVESGSSHPLARAILERAAAEKVEVPAASEASAIPGRAVLASVAGRMLAVGSPRYAEELRALSERQRTLLEGLQAHGKTVVILLSGTAPLALFAIRDEPRPDARHGIATLQGLGVQPVMLTGDNHRTGAAIALALGLEAKAELLPDDKLREIAALKAQAPIAMVGDGINDAPALAASSVGIAMGGGTDVALETADAALLKNRVTGVAELIALSRATLANIRENIAISLGLKGVFLITSLFGVTTLWMAILADTGATVIVTMNALRLLTWRPNFREASKVENDKTPSEAATKCCEDTACASRSAAESRPSNIH